MKRILLLLPMLLFSGCSQPESPHFVPATAGTSKPAPADRQAPASGVEPLIKIPMH